MKFKSHIGKRVYTGVREIVFLTEFIETDDEKDIKALQGALDVEEVKSKKTKKDEQEPDLVEGQPDPEPEKQDEKPE